MTIAFETPRQRRDRHLRDASQARDIAANAPNETVRVRYLKLANISLTIAAEIPDLRDNPSEA
jgi:hypothetical protein